MVSDRTRELLFPITILVSVAVGVMIGGVFARSGKNVPSPASVPAPDDKAVVDAIDAVRAELVRVRERLDATSVTSSAKAPVESRSSAAPDATMETRQVTAALLEAANSLRSVIAGFGGGSAPLVLPKTVDPAVWSDLDHQSFEESKKSYLLWNYQQVLDRFGQPYQFGADNSGTYWMYNRGQGRTTMFRFTDGMVTAVQTSG